MESAVMYFKGMYAKHCFLMFQALCKGNSFYIITFSYPI